jgi:endonuclease-3
MTDATTDAMTGVNADAPPVPTAATATKPPPKRKAAKKKVKRRKPNPYLAWAKRLERMRPGLVTFTLEGLAGLYGHHPYERRWDPTSELVMTILTQNSADINAEHAYQELRKAYPSDRPVEQHRPGPGWGGVGMADGVPPDWSMVDAAPLEELVEVIRPGGLPNQKAKGIKAALRSIHEARGDYSLEFLGDMTALEARTWLTGIKGVGVKTASVVLLFSFGHPLMPVDRPVERVAARVGLLPKKATAEEAHDHFLAMLQPDEMHEAHVNLIRHGRLVCHARNPAHDRCPLRERCRFYDPKAP